MSRYIDADALKEYIDCGHLRNPCEVCFSELDVVNLIDAQPTIDAVPVIRCADCDHSSISATIEPRLGEIEPAGYICKMWRAPTRGEGFCHKALPKRKGRDE